LLLRSLSRRLTGITAFVGAVALAADVAVVFASVIWRYLLHSPLDWAEEVARALMVTLVFAGVATATGRGRHIGVDLFLDRVSERARRVIAHAGRWVVFAVSVGLAVSAWDLLQASFDQTTETGLPQAIYVLPVLIGAAVMAVAALEHAWEGPTRAIVAGAVALVAVIVVGRLFLSVWPDPAAAPGWLMILCFVLCVVCGIPIAFSIGMAAMSYFLASPFLPFTFFSQQVAAGVDHFVLLSIPFFLLAGAAMEVNGMSSRLVELIVRGMGRIRGGLGVTIVVTMAFFSGISGSKLADVAAVGGVLMPAVRRVGHSSEDSAGLFAASAVMAEAIPPCVNLIVIGFVANISIGALFVAGLVPAALLLMMLVIAAVVFGRPVDVDAAYPVRMPMRQLILGATVGLIMILMIGRGVVAGIATSTEISAFAVVYALVVGRLAFRELTVKATLDLFVRVAANSGMLLFIVAAAGSLSYALTIQMIPQTMAAGLVSLAQHYGGGLFLALTLLMVVVFGAVLEGAPALIILAPILVPIAVQLGYSSLHYGILVVLTMGLGLFSPPVGLGLYATCGVCDVQMKNVIRPMMKYLVVLVAGIVLLAAFPSVTTWLPRVMGYAVG
jgi:tripartite ATP-independent transporter DctM subunit